MTRHKLSTAAVLLATLAPTFASAQGEAPGSGQSRYRDCLALVAEAPERALGQAEAWELEGGGNAARHCAATALVAAGRPAEGATRLDDLVRELENVDPGLAGELAKQAGAAWQLAGRMDRARGSFGRALAIDPEDREALVRRGWTLGNLADYEAAAADFTAALALRPDDPEVLRHRAAAYRFLGDYDRALADIERAISADPGSPDAYLERGNIRRLMENQGGAEADWRHVVAMAPDSAAAAAARTNLRRLEE
ncbi:MAG TPA: tetratricopeptide repeat protein [Alphaproteobacteria bacterium]|nr:tetratricopeptide repeat protein [Alphaproteobacteria bacterium]